RRRGRRGPAGAGVDGGGRRGRRARPRGRADPDRHHRRTGDRGGPRRGQARPGQGQRGGRVPAVRRGHRRADPRPNRGTRRRGGRRVRRRRAHDPAGGGVGGAERSLPDRRLRRREHRGPRAADGRHRPALGRLGAQDLRGHPLGSGGSHRAGPLGQTARGRGALRTGRRPRGPRPAGAGPGARTGGAGAMTGRETDHDQQTVTDRQRARAELVARLTAKGEPFARAPEDVLGVTMPVFTHRHRSLRAVLAESARLGDREYLVDDERRISYRAHLAEVAALAVALRERHGIGPGDRVAILAANSPAWVQAFWACQCLGAIAVGYNAWWTPREIAYALGHTRPSVVIADGRRAERLAGSGTEAEPGTEAAPGTNVPLLRVEHDVPALIADFAGADLP